VQHGRGDVTERAVAQAPADVAFAAQDDGYGVRRVRGVRGVELVIPHLFGVAVIRRHDRRGVDGADLGQDPSEAAVQRLDRDDRGIQTAGVADHVGIGEIADHDLMFPAADVRDEIVGDPGRAHLRLQIVGRHLL
jgi:hypothetical protein